MRIVSRRNEPDNDNDSDCLGQKNATDCRLPDVDAGERESSASIQSLRNARPGYCWSTDAFIESELSKLGQEILWEPIPERLLEPLRRKMEPSS